ncbi:MAG: hypothetical protein WBD99_02030 [Thermodesulfobacteriota bacterium]
MFDQDGTLYPADSRLAFATREKTKSWLMGKLRITRQDVDSLYQNLASNYPNPFHGFQSIGASVSEYHSQVFDTINPCDYLSYDVKLRKVLLKLPQVKFVVTLASPLYSKLLQRCLGIADLIEKIYYVKDFAPDYSKKRCYEIIAKTLRIDTSYLSIVGDNFNLDIAPALDVGCTAIHISNVPIPGAHDTISTVYELVDIFTDSKLRSDEYGNK